MYKKDAGNKFTQVYETERDRVKFLRDTNGDGKADAATVFADNFGSAGAGIAAGVLARKGDVYLTCIPDVYKLRDTKGDGVADKIESLSTGYGVHTALLGHDLHGLKIGPDGRLYYTIGDRGINVTTKEGKKLFYPDMGTLMRCELDGSKLEVVSWGLRNPQEIAFDDRGDLFTCDNNCDAGDKARAVYLVPESDSGWRTGLPVRHRVRQPRPVDGREVMGDGEARTAGLCVAADRPHRRRPLGADLLPRHWTGRAV